MVLIGGPVRIVFERDVSGVGIRVVAARVGLGRVAGFRWVRSFNSQSYWPCRCVHRCAVAHIPSSTKVRAPVELLDRAQCVVGLFESYDATAS